MSYAEDMRDIIVSNVGDRLRFFIQVDPETRTQDVLFAREDLEWSDRKAAVVDSELHELVAKESYEEHMEAGEVTQIIKVADRMVMFTGFIEDEVVVVTFDRGILQDLPAVVAEFREYMIDNDIDFTALAVPE
ncbi:MULTISPECIES: hypothetical protein [unclassified Haloparvum]|uniref:hypothetical protein n=1 Tax=Haloparvum sp. PAK95 TaxID=3418962 RepID=UPI003D2E9D50